MTRVGTRRAKAARDAVGAVAVWTALEGTVRWAGQVLALLAAPTAEGIAGRLETADAWAVLVSAVLLGVCFRRRARSRGLGWVELGYRCTREAAAAGVTGGIAVTAVAALAAGTVDGPVFGPGRTDGVLRGIAEAGPWVAVLVVVANGLVGPAVEEYAWRGYVQRAATETWGPAAGAAATAAAFTAKHVVVDLSAGRTASLAVIALALGAIAARWGTAASTVAHAILNTTATLVVLALALRGP
jgi:membrane protease YdiL (CAAX protease family)